LEKEETEKLLNKDATFIEKSQKHEEYTGQKRERQQIQYEKSVEERRRKKKMVVSA
jgi:hypothetical protein